MGMRRAIAAAAAILAIGWTCQSVLAQNGQGSGDGEGQRRGRLAARRAERPGRGDGERMMEALKKLDLTDEQKAQVKQVLDTHKQAVENWRKENEEKGKALREKARDAKTREDRQAIREEFVKLMQSRRELHEKLVEQLKDILTEEQAQKLRGMFGPRGGDGPRGHRPMDLFLGALRRLELTEEQKTKVRGIMEAAKEAADKAESRQEKGKAIKAALDTIREDVLTDAQRQKLTEMRQQFAKRHNPLAALDLTEEQTGQIEKIMADAKAAADQAETRQEKWKIHMEARKKIADEVLTEEQVSKLKEMHRRGVRKAMGHVADALGMSEQQREQAKAIMEQARKDMQAAETREDKHKIMVAARKKIADEVLTAEQREKIEQFRKEHGRGEGEGRRGRPMRPRRGRGKSEDEGDSVE